MTAAVAYRVFTVKINAESREGGCVKIVVRCKWTGHKYFEAWWKWLQTQHKHTRGRSRTHLERSRAITGPAGLFSHRFFVVFTVCEYAISTPAHSPRATNHDIKRYTCPT